MHRIAQILWNGSILAARTLLDPSNKRILQEKLIYYSGPWNPESQAKVWCEAPLKVFKLKSGMPGAKGVIKATVSYKELQKLYHAGSFLLPKTIK